MIFSYICPYRFISTREIRAPFGHQSAIKLCCSNHFKQTKKPVFSRLFIVHYFSITKIQILFFIVLIRPCRPCPGQAARRHGRARYRHTMRRPPSPGRQAEASQGHAPCQARPSPHCWSKPHTEGNR